MRYRRNETGFSEKMVDYFTKHRTFANGVFHDQDFSGLNLGAINFSGADLSGSNFSNTSLVRANFQGCELGTCLFNSAKLNGAAFDRAWLKRSDFENASCVGSTFKNADLEHTSWHGAKIIDALFWNASLSDADFTGAQLSSVEMIDVEAERVAFDNASLDECTFRNARMRSALFIETDLRYTSFEGALLTGATFEKASLLSCRWDNALIAYASFTGVIMEADELQGAFGIETAIFSSGKSSPGSRTAYGRKRKVSKALRKVEAPIKASAFKAMSPAAWEVLKQDLPNIQTLTPDLSKEILKSYGMDWQVTSDSYTAEAQRLSTKPNEVLQLNVDIEALTSDYHVQMVLRRMAELSHRSGHPTLMPLGKPLLFTVGWVRYNEYPDERVLLVEEIQSDLPTVRKASDDDIEEFRTRLQRDGREQAFDQALAIMKPYEDRFYFDALSLVFDIALEKGLEVEMLTYKTKKEFGSPTRVYEELPRKMGMTKRSKVASPLDLPEVWHMVPNHRRIRRAY